MAITCCIMKKIDGKGDKMSGLDIGVDLGTTSIIICVNGKGIVLDEPSVVAVNKRNQSVLAVGAEAYQMLGKTPEYIVAEHPMKDGVISEYEMTELMVQEFIKKVCGNLMVKPRIAICIPSSVTNVEASAVVEAAVCAGARKVYLIEEPIAAALGAGIDISAANGILVVDIGGGTTDIAVISLSGIVKSRSVKCAGNRIDAEIVKYFTQQHKLLIGERTAENLKKNIGTVFEPKESLCDVVKGRNLLTGLPVKMEISQAELYPVIRECVDEIIAALKEVLEITPPELVGDIYSNGIVLTGGGAKIQGLPELLQQEFGIEAKLAEQPENCVAIGAAKAFDVLDDLNEGFVEATTHNHK